MSDEHKQIFSSNKDVVLTTKLGTRKVVEVISGEEQTEEVKRFNRLLTEINEHIDIDYATSFVNNVLTFIDKFYFRSSFVGIEDGLPKKNDPLHPLIYASNHSGMSFPWDGIVMASRMLQLSNYEFENAIRPVFAPMLAESIYMNPFMLDNFWKRLGGVPATFENFEAMMHTPDANVLIYPEGVPGIGKGFDKKYQLQKVASSFIRMALKFEVDIIPVATINGEYLNPYSYKSDELNKFVNKLKIPFLPLGPISLIVPIYPWAFYFALPAKITYCIGKPIKVYEMTDKPFHKIQKKDINKIKGIVQEQMQAQLTQGVEMYGQDPYGFDELGELWAKNMDKILYILPSGWPVLFLEHDRLYRENGGKPFQMDYSNTAFMGSLLKNKDAIPFNLPVAGWPILLKSKNIF